jgi:hypothetical protein
MTIPGFSILNMLVGASVAYSARVQIRSLQRPVFYNRYFTALLMLEVLIFLPVGIYFNGFYPDWSWMYLLDTRALPPGVTAMAMAIYPVTATMGYLVGYFSSKSNSDWVSVMFMGFLLLGLMGLLAVGTEKLGNVGTFDQYHNNVNLQRWTDTSLLPSVIVVLLGIPVAWGYLLLRFWREGNVHATAGMK